jgi:two-component system, chemotaxis family, CheB/CheR fusion protein
LNLSARWFTFAITFPQGTNPMANSRKSSARSRRNKSAPQKQRGGAKKQKVPCPIVGIGGSAGGFEAAMELLQNLPPANGMAFVIVQHLDPRHTSRLPSLLGKVTQMDVLELRGRIVPQPNRVYVQPPDKCVICEDGALTLVKRTERLNLAIDHFFESLAEAQGARAIGVVLSGTGSDGTAGLRAIKAAGGLTFAQDEASAKYPSMPRSAIQSGFVDAALSPKEIAQEIKRIADHPYIRDGGEVTEAGEAGVDLDDVGRIFLTLRKHTGVDFSAYKQSTLLRRIHRRMALHRMERMDQYVRFLAENHAEIDSLFNDLLINVTRFFRDTKVFEALRRKFIPALIKAKQGKGDLRVWVPGCATGEEVYSLAICILEALGKRAGRMRVQIFGTDLSESAIDRARLGIYSSAIEKDVSRQRLNSFFKKLDSTYQINRSVRDLCTFARQNITADPPFSRIDLISCRNVLIYLGVALQKRSLPIFHYALNPGGYLVLGPSETVGAFGDLFELVDRRAKIYAKKIVIGRPEMDFRSYASNDLKLLEPPRATPPPSEGDDFNMQMQQMADRILLGNYAPAGVIIDSAMQVRHFRGHTARFLEHPAGPATLNLLQLARAGLVPDLRSAVHSAIKSHQPVGKGNIAIKQDGKIVEVEIEVVPFKIPTSDTPWLLVMFKDAEPSKKPVPKTAKGRRTAKQREVIELQEALAATKESLQAIIEEQEATNEELKSANEEIESSNEELQSTNEELETAKEELQSTNEELTTLNEELSNRNMEMIQVNSDLNNLLSSVHIPIVMVDNNLKVRRATPTARAVFNIMESDIGRPLTELKPQIDMPHLEKILRDVVDTLSTREDIVADGRGRQHSLRVRPYRTSDNKIDGAVLTLVDLGQQKSEKKK